MEKRVDLAIENFKKGYNCSQAVVCAYCDAFGIKEEDAFRMAEGFGGGMGGLGETCGAVTGMYMVLSLLNSKGNLQNPRETKQDTYKVIQELSKEFEVDPEEFLSKGRATPLTGMKLFGRNLLTVKDGEIIYKM